MKKILFTVLATLLMFVSCAKIDVVRDIQIPQNDMEIVFSAQAGNGLMTKAIVDGTTLPDASNFGVYGFTSASTNPTVGSGLIIKNGKYLVNGTSASATDNESYFWPKADNVNDIKVNFFAYHPYDATKVSIDANKVVTYNIAASELNSANAVDFLYATRYQVSPVVTANANAVDVIAPVDLTFKHALSLIEFQGKKAADQNITNVNVTAIEFLNNDGSTLATIKTSGTMTLDIDATYANEAAFVPTFDYTNASTSNSLNFAVNSIKSNLNAGTNYTDADILSRTVLVPQAVPAKVRITFDITITNTNGSDAITYSGRTVTRTINDGTDENNKTYKSQWVSGKKYIYKYYISVDEIEFTVNVVDWTEDTESIFQIWDHTAQAYYDRFFDKASTIMGNCIEGQNHIMA